MPNTNQVIGYEIGDSCNRNKCPGIIENQMEGESCTCFISPPCAKCTDDFNFCPICDWNCDGTDAD